MEHEIRIITDGVIYVNKLTKNRLGRFYFLVFWKN